MADVGTSPEPLNGLEIVDRHGDKVGRVRQIYSVDGKPAWAGVRGNLLASTEVLVPLEGAKREGDTLGVAIDRERVRAAPRRDPDTPIAAGEAERLRGFYGLPALPLADVAPAPAPEPDPEPAAELEPQDEEEDAVEAVEAVEAPSSPVSAAETTPSWSLWDPMEEARYARSLQGAETTEDVTASDDDEPEDEAEHMDGIKRTGTPGAARAPRSLYDLDADLDEAPVTAPVHEPVPATGSYFDDEPTAVEQPAGPAPAIAWDLDDDESDDDPMPTPAGAWDLTEAEQQAPAAVAASWDLEDDEQQPAPAPTAAWDLEDEPEEAPAAATAWDLEPEPVAPVAPVVAVADMPDDDPLTLSEERLHADAEAVPQTRVRLTKVVVTEERTITVQVRREELRVVREPIADGEPVAGYEPVDGEESEIVLHEERVVVTTEFVPVERIRLVRESVAEDRQVTQPVRKEHLAFGS